MNKHITVYMLWIRLLPNTVHTDDCKFNSKKAQKN